MPLPLVACFDTNPYDQESFSADVLSRELDIQFLEHRLNSQTALSAQGCKAVIAFVNDHLDARTLQKLADIEVSLLALRSAGFNNVDLKEAKRLELHVVRVPAYSPHAVAEHAMALLLTLNRKIHRAYNRIREHNFSLNGLVGFDLFGKTVGIIGTGKIGKTFAQIVSGFGCKILCHDPFPDLEWAASRAIHYQPLEEVLVHSDILSLHAPLLPETTRLMNQDRFGRMKPGAILVNTSRGKLIDTAAAIVALKSGHLGGLALDVYEEEEGIFFEDLSGQILKNDELSLLLSFPNVLITAHQAFLTREALASIAHITLENVLAHQRGLPFLPGTLLV